MKRFIYLALFSLFISNNGYPKTKKMEANAFRQSEKLLKMAANELVEEIKKSDNPMWKDFPERKKILLNVLPYENLVKLPGKDNEYKDGILLSMDYQLNPHQIFIYKPFYTIYAGTSDSEFNIKTVEVKKELLMEAFHIWGIEENESEIFANNFLQINVSKPTRLRPENSIFVNTNYCSCLNRKPDIENNCDSFCRMASETDFGPTLYGSVNLSEKLINDQEYGTLDRWCNNEIPGTKGFTPKCVLRVDNGNSKEDLDISIGPNSNHFMVNLNVLKMNVTYVAKIVETGSGTNNASSDEFQIKRVSPQSSAIFTGPLTITPIDQYVCITKTGEFDPNTRSNYFNLTATNHYYYKKRNGAPIGPSDDFLYCYDRNQFGPTDKISFPRLDLVSRTFYLWDQFDARFSDTNGDGIMDINNLIDTEMLNRYGLQVSTNYFVPFKWPTSPLISFDGRNGQEDQIPTLGYFMKVFLDPNTGLGKCPTQEDYFGTDTTYEPLRGIVGLDTEAIYIGVRKKETLTNPDASKTEFPLDIIFIRESKLKRIWFYFENGLIVKPDEIALSQKMVHFFYPPSPDYTDPFVQKSYQSLYTLIDRDSFNSYAPNIAYYLADEGLPPHDKKFGCVPTIDSKKIENSNRDIISQTLPKCSEDSECFPDERCSGNRCWDKKSVSNGQDSEDLQESRGMGETCKYDYECASYCCQKSTGKCGGDILSEIETKRCSKAPGETCVTKEYCRKENINTCFVVKIGTTETGKQECAIRCYDIPTFGDCQNGYCIAPSQPPIPKFDPYNPDCSTAIDPPLIHSDGRIEFSKKP